MTEPTFNRRLHLGLALVALLHGPLAMRIPDLLPIVVAAERGGPELDTIARLIHLCFAAVVAWLAFAVFDTHAGVTILPQRWRALGWRLPAVFVIVELVIVVWWGVDPASRSLPFVGHSGKC